MKETTRQPMTDKKPSTATGRPSHNVHNPQKMDSGDRYNSSQNPDGDA
jgi:hypothetical protein